MKIIKKPKENLAIIWRRPNPTQAIYRPMKFLLQAQVDDGLLLYNVVTSEMVLLDDQERRVFDKTPAEYSTAMDELIARHFLVKEEFDENKSVRELRAIVKKLEPSTRIDGFTILPTTECNARCYYCFESDHKRCTMTEKIVSDSIDYIAEKCKGDAIQICWFGGEPLVGRKQISRICEGLREKGISFTSTMVSNAYLFDDELVQIAKNEWNLTNVQITLDGTEKVYNETKAYINTIDNPYKRVIRNIELLLKKGIAVSVRLNVTDKNVADLNELIDELAERFGEKKGIACYSHAVYEGVGFEPLIYDDGIRERLDKQVADLDNKLRSSGLLGSLSQLPSLRVIRCMSDNDSCRLIYPDGTIGKCENRSSDECIGDIYRDIVNKEMDSRYKSTEQFAACENCCLFPNCVNLTICPETGKCSKYKRDWKMDRYIAIMEEQYTKYKQNALSHNDDVYQMECDS